MCICCSRHLTGFIILFKVSNKGLTTKGINREFNKRSFVKHRSTSSKPRYRLSEGEDPLSSLNGSSVISKHLSNSSLDPISSVTRLRSTSDSPKVGNHSPRVGKDASPEISRGWNDNSPTVNTKAGKELSPRCQGTRNAISPDPHSHRVGKVISPDLYRTGHNSDQWDYSIASSQSESSVDILSGSCDSLDNDLTEAPIVSKSSSPPIKRGESSTIKVPSVEKKQVIRNLATITSLSTQVVEGKRNDDEDKSPCGPEPQIICSHHLDASADLNDMSHDPTIVSHDPTIVSQDSTNVSHDPTSTSDDSVSVSHGDPPSASGDPTGVSHDPDVIMPMDDSNTSTQSVHVEFNSPQQSLEEEPSQVSTKRHHNMSIRSVQSIGKYVHLQLWFSYYYKQTTC